MGDYNYMVDQNEYLANQISDKLSRTVIRNAVLSEDGEDVGFQVVRKGKGRGNYDVITVWVLRDPEGNGPGWLDIEE